MALVAAIVETSPLIPSSWTGIIGKNGSAQIAGQVWKGPTELRRLARTGSAVDALVVAIAEPGGTVLTHLSTSHPAR
jgi:hypothetical protein